MLPNGYRSEKVNAKSNFADRLQGAGAYVNRQGIFRSRDMVAAGFPREYLRRLVNRGRVRRISRGLYAPAGFDGDQHQSLVELGQRVPRGVVCLLSALQFHGIGTQSPREVWLALPRGSRRPRVANQALHCCLFSGAAQAFGIERHSLRGGEVRVYSAAKTVADCFKYRHKVGLDVAIEALREGWRERKFSMMELSAAAAVCRVSRVMQPYLEMLT